MHLSMHLYDSIDTVYSQLKFYEEELGFPGKSDAGTPFLSVFFQLTLFKSHLPQTSASPHLPFFRRGTWTRLALQAVRGLRFALVGTDLFIIILEVVRESYKPYNIH